MTVRLAQFSEALAGFSNLIPGGGFAFLQRYTTAMAHGTRRAALAAFFGLIPVPAARAGIGAQTVLRRAKKLRWVQATAGLIDFRVEMASRGEHELERLQRKLVSAQQRAQIVLGEPLRLRIRALIVGSRESAAVLLGRPVNGFAIGDVAVMVFNDRIDAVGPHEPCHCWSSKMWGKPSGEWIAEGLAVHADGHWQGAGLHACVARLRSAGRLIPLESLIHHRWSKSGYPDATTYPQSGSFVQFLFARYGRDAVKQLWKQGRSAKQCEVLLRRPFAEVEREWLSEGEKQKEEISR
jgi:hypothetical protein